MEHIAKSMVRSAVLFCIMCAGPFLYAQISDRVSKVTVAPSAPDQPVTINVDLVSPDRIERVEVAYRMYGQAEFQRTEASITGNTASALIPAAAVAGATTLEYYVLIYPRGGGATETYPIENPDQQPLRASLLPQETGAAMVTLLSPDENESVAPGELLISFFVNQADTSAPLPSVEVRLDNADMTSMAVRTGNLFVVKPENLAWPLSPGAHSLTIVITDSAGNVLKKISRGFSVSGGAPIPVKTRGVPSWGYTTSVQLESRHETISDVETPYNRATIAASGTYTQYRIDGKLYLTNEEREDRQPQNRYFLGFESSWLRLGIGDVFPALPQLIMNGKRVRGFTGSLSLGGLNIDFVTGTIVRRVKTDLSAIIPATDTAALRQQDPSAMISLIDTTSVPNLYGVFRQTGTFTRNITVVHPIFGRRDGNHIGFTYLKSADELSSILTGLNPRVGNAPEENLVLGSDFRLLFDRRRIELTGEVAFSATNKDFTSGTFSDEDIERVYPPDSYSQSDRDNVRRIRDIFSRLITVNEYLVPLGTRNMPTLAYDAGMSFNYFNNFLKLSYLRHGESFESFGQSYVRTDVVGYSISDRLRLYQNSVYLSGGYERLQDNTADTKPFTTTANTINVSVSYYPLIQLPNITVGYLNTTNDNLADNPDSASTIDDRTGRFFISLGKDFELGVRHQAMLNVSTSSRTDNTPRGLDTRNTAVSMNVTSSIRPKFETNLGFSVNSSRVPQTDSTQAVHLTTLSYTSLLAGAQYRTLEDRLRFSASVNPTFGDFERTLINGDVQYYFLRQISIQTQISLYLNRTMFNQTGSTNDIIWGVTLRADI